MSRVAGCRVAHMGWSPRSLLGDLRSPVRPPPRVGTSALVRQARPRSSELCVGDRARGLAQAQGDGRKLPDAEGVRGPAKQKRTRP